MDVVDTVDGEDRGGGGGGENDGEDFSSSRIEDSAGGESQGGGRMLARRCFLRRRASQRGIVVRCGGMRGGRGPCFCFFTVSAGVCLCILEEIEDRAGESEVFFVSTGRRGKEGGGTD